MRRVGAEIVPKLVWGGEGQVRSAIAGDRRVEDRNTPLIAENFMPDSGSSALLLMPASSDRRQTVYIRHKAQLVSYLSMDW
jgi:hypothetical protein